MKTLTKKQVAATTAVAALAIAMPFAALAASGPDRPNYYCGTVTNICQGADHVQFDSFANNPSYDQHNERNFLTVRPAGSGAYSDSAQLAAGQEYEVRAYVHNNADPAMVSDPNKYNAQNTTFKVSLPSTVNGSADATGYISASNANPGTVYDTVTLKSSGSVNVAYEAGSAVWTNSQGQGGANGATLGDVTSGALLGYSSLNGVLPGCFNYSGYVTFKVKVTSPNTPVTPPVTPTTPAAPGAPAALPQTGPEELAGVAGMAGTGAIGYAVVAYRRSKKALADRLLNRK